MQLEQPPDDQQPEWTNSPTSVGLYLAVAFLSLTFGVLLPVILIAAIYTSLRKVDLPRIHAALGAIVFGESLAIVAGAVLSGDLDLLARGAIDIALPSIIYLSYLTGTFAMARRCAWILWLLMAFEAYAASVLAVKIVAQPTAALVVYFAAHVAALVAAGTIVFGADRLARHAPNLDLFD